jgi:hypothetical protein
VPEVAAHLRVGVSTVYQLVREGRLPASRVLQDETSELAGAGVTLTAEELACTVPVPEAVVDDSDRDFWAEVQEGLVEAVAVALDAAVFSGIAKPATWPDSIVGAATAAGNVVTAGTATVPQGVVVGDTSRPPWTATWMASPAGLERDLQGPRSHRGPS